MCTLWMGSNISFTPRSQQPFLPQNKWVSLHIQLIFTNSSNDPPNPFVPDGTTGRWTFRNHAWVEVLNDPYNINYRTVLDATTAVTNGAHVWPDNGSRSRGAYATAHIDAAADPTGGSTGDLVDRVFPEPSTGDCCKSHDVIVLACSITHSNCLSHELLVLHRVRYLSCRGFGSHRSVQRKWDYTSTVA